jgi:hypothetical protein
LVKVGEAAAEAAFDYETETGCIDALASQDVVETAKGYRRILVVATIGRREAAFRNTGGKPKALEPSGAEPSFFLANGARGAE